MECTKCGSTNLSKNGFNKHGNQKYVCKDCGFFIDLGINGGIPVKAEIKPKKLGISITEFRKKHDVDFIVGEMLKKLQRNTFLTKSEVIQLTGLRSGYPGLSGTLEAASDYMGKAGGTTYWAHPDSIRELKNETIML